MKTRTKSIILLVVGIVLLVLGIIFLTLFKELIKDEVHEQVVLKQGTEVFEGWKDTPFPILFKFWFFNCTNCKEDFKNDTFKPNLEEVGPYTLDLKWEKENIVEYEYKMEYDSIRKFSYSEIFSNPNVSLKDTVVMPNVIALTVGYAANHFLQKSTLVDYSTVKELDCDRFDSLFLDGTYCRLIKWLWRCRAEDKPYIDMNIGDFLLNGVKSECILEPLHNISVDDQRNFTIPDTFSLFGGDTLEGRYVVYTGEDDLTKRSFIDTFDGSSTNGEAWVEGSVCNDITGTDGQLWIPFATKEDKVSIWSSDIKRSLPFLYEEDVRVKEAFGYSYAIRKDAFNNSTSNKENECYEWQVKPDGAYHYRDPFPLAMSHPHFLYADSYWTDNITGMNPDENIHRSKFVVEPVTGVPLEVKINLQANFHVYQPQLFEDTEYEILNETLERGWRHVKDYYHPLLWFSTYSIVDQGTADDMVLLTENLEVILNAIGGCLVAIGGSLILAVPILIHFKWEKRGRRKSSS